MKPLPLIRLLLLILLPTALWSCSDEADTAASSKVQTVTLNVDVKAPVPYTQPTLPTNYPA